MDRTVLILGGITVAAIGIGFVRRYTRAHEFGPNGNPALRYLAEPYVMAGCGAASLAVGIYQWFVPINHHYAGNLLVLSYVPAVLGVLFFLFAAHLLVYRVTLRSDVIEVSGWPLKSRALSLSNLVAIDGKGSSTVLRFVGGKKYVIYSNMSGKAGFLAALRANNSIQRTQTRYAG